MSAYILSTIGEMVIMSDCRSEVGVSNPPSCAINSGNYNLAEKTVKVINLTTNETIEMSVDVVEQLRKHFGINIKTVKK